MNLLRPPHPSEVLAKLGVHPKKRLSQNFLVSEDLAERIVLSLPQDTEYVVEIGAGTGALTYWLAKHFKQVLAVEIDPKLAYFLETHFANTNVKVVCQDFLKLDLAQVANQIPDKLLLVGNLPYGISSPVFERVLVFRPKISSAHFLLQREFAQRILSPAGTRQSSPLGLLIQHRFEVSKGLVVPPSAFYPKPEVVSWMVHLLPRETPLFAASDKFLSKVFHAAYSARRKRLKKNLHSLFKNRSAIDKVWAKLGFSDDLRAEQLSVEEWNQLLTELGSLPDSNQQ